jgi:hypothetical protein
MKKLFFILFLAPLLAHAQQYTRAEIGHVADSILRSYIGDAIFAHATSEVDDDSYVCYSYIGKKGKVKYSRLPRPNTFTKGAFNGITLKYKVQYPYPKCPACDVVKGQTSVILDHHLRMKTLPDISFIPDYVWAKDSCHFRPGGY